MEGVGADLRVHPTWYTAVLMPNYRFVILSLALLSSCTYVNTRLNPANVATDQRLRNSTLASFALAPATQPAAPENNLAGPRPTTQPRDDGYFVGLAISGGGLRSANFSAACMFQLQSLGLLDHVDYISSVSGAAWNPGNVQQ